MNPRKIIYLLFAACAAALIALFLLRDHKAIERTPYFDLLVMDKLPFDSGIKLRGETKVRGTDEFERGMKAYDQDRFDEAIPDLQKALKLQPDSAGWSLYLGICYYMSKQPEDAVETLELANKSADPGIKPHTRWYLALARLMNAQRDPAEELLDKLVKEKGLYHNEARELLIRLRKLATGDPNKTSVYAPAADERFTKGRAIKIQWGGGIEHDALRYRIMLSQDGGVTFPITLIQGIPADQKSWNWPTAETHGEKLKVRVDAVTPDSTILGTPSDEFALIIPPLLMLLSPDPGQTLRGGLTYTVAWKIIGDLPNYISVALTQFNGREYEHQCTAIYGADPSDGKAEWTVVAEAGEQYRLRLDAEFSDTTISIFSSADFSLKPAVELAIVSAPSTTASSSEHLSWTLTGPAPRHYRVELCDSTGNTLRMLADHLAATDTHYVCAQPVTNGNLMKLTAIYDEGKLVVYNGELAFNDGATTLQSAQNRRSKALAQAIELQQNFPNPFNNSTTIRFTITESAQTKLAVYNIHGQLVTTLLDKALTAGTHDATFDAANLASGAYIYRLESGGKTQERQMVLTK